MSNSNYMFAYGMNTNRASMKIRCPNAVYIGNGVLKNHRFDFRYHADVRPDFEYDVEGALWELDAKSLELIDRAEGYPVYYTRKIENIVANGKIIPAWVYKMVDLYEPLRNPPDHYWTNVLLGYEDLGIDVVQLDNAITRIERKHRDDEK